MRRRAKKGELESAEGTKASNEPTPEEKAANASARFGGQSVAGRSGAQWRELNADASALETTIRRTAEHLNRSHPAFSADVLPQEPMFAQVEGFDISTLPQNFAAVEKMTEVIRAFQNAEPKFAEQMTHVRQAFGDGETLKMMFQRMFPGQWSRPFVREDGDPVLTSAEVAVLREAACDISYKEIAQRLGIEARTVNSHLTKIYKKLNVRRPLTAVAVAISMGYLDMDAMEFMARLGGVGGRNFTNFDCITTSVVAGNMFLPDNEKDLLPLTEFALFLMVVAHSTASERVLGRIGQAQPVRRCDIRQINRRGEIVQRLDADFLHGRCSFAIAPPHAAARGFVPGNIFVHHSVVPNRSFNSWLISEFTSEGRYIRSFGGGAEVGTRLGNGGAPAFHRDGYLLVPSAGNALVRFSKGGALAFRWIEGIIVQVAVGPDGRVVTANHSAVGAPIRIYSASGKLLAASADTLAGGNYDAVAVLADNRLWVVFADGKGESRLLRFTPEGEPLSSQVVPGMASPHLHTDAYDRLYIPCARSHDIKVLSPLGEIIERIPLPKNLLPYAVATPPNGNGGNENGNLWVSGVVSE